MVWTTISPPDKTRIIESETNESKLDVDRKNSQAKGWRLEEPGVNSHVREGVNKITPRRRGPKGRHRHILKLPCRTFGAHAECLNSRPTPSRTWLLTGGPSGL